MLLGILFFSSLRRNLNAFYIINTLNHIHPHYYYNTLMSVLSKNRTPFHSTGPPTPTTKPLSSPFQQPNSSEGFFILIICFFPHTQPSCNWLLMNNHKPNNFSLLEPDVCRCYQTQTRVFSKLSHSKFSVIEVSTCLHNLSHSALSFALCLSDRSHLLLCFSKTILQLQMSSEIPLPLRNRPLRHCMRSSPPFIGLIFICNFKFVLHIYTVSTGQLIKNFYLFSFQFLLPYSYLALSQGAYWCLSESVVTCGLCFAAPLGCFKVKHLLLNLFCLKLFNLPNTREKKLSENLFSYRY